MLQPRGPPMKRARLCVEPFAEPPVYTISEVGDEYQVLSPTPSERFALLSHTETQTSKNEDEVREDQQQKPSWQDAMNALAAAQKELEQLVSLVNALNEGCVSMEFQHRQPPSIEAQTKELSIRISSKQQQFEKAAERLQLKSKELRTNFERDRTFIRSQLRIRRAWRIQGEQIDFSFESVGSLYLRGRPEAGLAELVKHELSSERLVTITLPKQPPHPQIPYLSLLLSLHRLTTSTTTTTTNTTATTTTTTTTTAKPQSTSLTISSSSSKDKGKGMEKGYEKEKKGGITGSELVVFGNGELETVTTKEKVEGKEKEKRNNETQVWKQIHQELITAQRRLFREELYSQVCTEKSVIREAEVEEDQVRLFLQSGDAIAIRRTTEVFIQTSSLSSSGVLHRTPVGEVLLSSFFEVMSHVLLRQKHRLRVDSRGKEPTWDINILQTIGSLYQHSLMRSRLETMLNSMAQRIPNLRTHWRITKQPLISSCFVFFEGSLCQQVLLMKNEVFLGLCKTPVGSEDELLQCLLGRVCTVLLDQLFATANSLQILAIRNNFQIQMPKDQSSLTISVIPGEYSLEIEARAMVTVEPQPGNKGRKPQQQTATLDWTSCWGSTILKKLRTLIANQDLVLAQLQKNATSSPSTAGGSGGGSTSSSSSSSQTRLASS